MNKPLYDVMLTADLYVYLPVLLVTLLTVVTAKQHLSDCSFFPSARRTSLQLFSKLRGNNYTCEDIIMIILQQFEISSSLLTKLLHSYYCILIEGGIT